MPAEATLDLLPTETDKAPTAKRDTPQKLPERPADMPTAPRRRHGPGAGAGAPGAVHAAPLALIGGAYWYVTGGQVMSTDDAYVNAETVGISTDVSGIVQQIDVTENQHVDSGQILYRLDPRQFQIALDNANANLAQTGLTIASMKQDYGRMLSDVTAQQAQVALDQAAYDRNASLVGTGAVSKATYDNARFTLAASRGKFASLRQQAAVQLAKLAGSADIPVAQHPQFLQAKALVDEAQRQLDDTVVRAPFTGIATQVSAIAPGNTSRPRRSPSISSPRITSGSTQPRKRRR
jgi:membrane fusion protein (multidrug efflux system)